MSSDGVVFVAAEDSKPLIRKKLTDRARVALEVVMESAELSGAAVLGALVAEPWPHLKRLVVREGDFDGLSEAPRKSLVSAKVAASFAGAFPALESLTLGAHRLLPGIDHPTLRELVLVGIPLGPRLLDAQSRLPALVSCSIRLPADSHGVAYAAFDLEALAKADLPSLERVDLGQLVVDGEWEAALAEASWRRPGVTLVPPGSAERAPLGPEALPWKQTPSSSTGSAPVARAAKPLAEWGGKASGDPKAVKAAVAKMGRADARFIGWMKDILGFGGPGYELVSYPSMSLPAPGVFPQAWDPAKKKSEQGWKKLFVVDGDLVVDGVLLADCHFLYVAGELRAHAVVSHCRGLLVGGRAVVGNVLACGPHTQSCFVRGFEAPFALFNGRAYSRAPSKGRVALWAADLLVGDREAELSAATPQLDEAPDLTFSAYEATVPMKLRKNVEERDPFSGHMKVDHAPSFEKITAALLEGRPVPGG